jgi:hypothetical protein
MEFSGALLAQPVQLHIRRFVDNPARFVAARVTAVPMIPLPAAPRSAAHPVRPNFRCRGKSDNIVFRAASGTAKVARREGTGRMKMRALISPFIFTTLLFGIPTAASAQTSNPLFGTWRVTSFKLQVIGERGEREFFGPNPKGYVILTPEPRIMAFIAADGRKPPTNQAEAAAMLQTMIAYTGRKAGAGQVHDRCRSFMESNVYGKPQVRFDIVEGDKLTLLT